MITNTVSSTKAIATHGAMSVLRRGIALGKGPVAYLRAYQRMQRFRAMDIHLLRDCGLTEKDVQRATLGDFLNQPHV